MNHTSNPPPKPGLDRTDTALVRVAAALCSSDEETLQRCFNEALDGGVTVAELREVILTSYLFDGYPTALEGFRILGGICKPGGGEGDDLTYSDEQITLWRERGKNLCRRIYGPNFQRLMTRVEQFAPELRQAMIIEGYGKVLARGGLNPLRRELCVVAILACKSRPRQLLSHTLGVLRLGASSEQLSALTASLGDIAPPKILAASQRTIDEAVTRINLP